MLQVLRRLLGRATYADVWLSRQYVSQRCVLDMRRLAIRQEHER